MFEGNANLYHDRLEFLPRPTRWHDHLFALFEGGLRSFPFDRDDLRFDQVHSVRITRWAFFETVSYLATTDEVWTLCLGRKAGSIPLRLRQRRCALEVAGVIQAHRAQVTIVVDGFPYFADGTV